MGLFDWLPTKKQSSNEKGKARPSQKGKNASPNRLENASKVTRPVARSFSKVSYSDSNTFKRIEHIPKHISILTAEKGDIILPPGLDRDYIVLLVNNEEKHVIIITSIEKTDRLSGIDHEMLDIKQRCHRKGYNKFENMYAPRQIIRLIYDNATSDSNNSAQDSIKTESLQVDFDNMLSDALFNGVSDIHIEVRRNSAKVRYRVNGALRVINDLSVAYARQLAIVIYQVIAEEKEVTFIETQQQAAIIDREVMVNGTSQRVRVRLNTLPAYPDGFDMVMRLLRMGVSTKKATLNSLGYSDTQLNDINLAVSRPVGAIIIAGTTGSGKSTSLSTMISRKIEYYTNEAGCRIKVITVEDPPENEIRHATQVPVVRSRNGKDGKNPFAEAMKAALRSDPDIIMVGEVRDEDSTELLVHTVQSGHQAYTTIHTSSAIGIVSRLRGLGIKNDVLGSSDFFSGLIYQALVPVTCQHCSTPFAEFEGNQQDNEDMTDLCARITKVTTSYDREKIRFINHSGCDKCVDGVSGRTVVAEVVVPDKKMKLLFGEGKDTQALEYFQEQGGKSILSHGIDKMSAGLCDPREIEHKLGRLTDIEYELNSIETKEDEASLLEAESLVTPNPLADIDLNNLELESSLLSGKKEDEPQGIIHEVDFTGKK